MTSTGSGLAVPDWPLSYGTLFPPMVGGVFYEHSHRLVATLVGFLTLCLVVWLAVKEERRWVRRLGFCALACVIAQGVVGGLTVLFFLPIVLSVSHAVLAQTFFIFTLFIAYSQSSECRLTEKQATSPPVLKLSLLLSLLVYVQLILGAAMRHAGSDPAVPNFLFFIHLLGAAVMIVMVGCLNVVCKKVYGEKNNIMVTLSHLDLLILVQLLLGVSTVLTQKSAAVTSFHVVTGASVLGVSMLLLLRVSPASWAQTKRFLSA